ncbi:MAG: UMP kinase, partial [Candidatus Diapherotrites archaeon]|nr:UMP kinase [Candidatus Diapherotrites archaeon]
MFPDISQLYSEENKVALPAQQQVPNGSMANVFVLSIGGSIIAPNMPDSEKIAELSACINELQREGYRFVVVVGGGKPAREYINAAKALGANQFVQDEIGIAITRANAAVFTATVENAVGVLLEIKESKQLLEQGKVPVFGGLLPGLTTDAVAALISEHIGATFVNLSNVDGIYDKDPRNNDDAKLFRELGHSELVTLVSDKVSKPGQNLVIDLLAAAILRRSKIRALFLNGGDLQNFMYAIRGLDFTGTVVSEAADEEVYAEDGKPARRKRGKSKRKAGRKPKGKFVEWE